MKSDTIIRVQDKWGRGPFRPGTTKLWRNHLKASNLPAIYQEVRQFASIIQNAHSLRMNVGCAVRAPFLDRWFDEGERKRLADLGFVVVDCGPCKILAETPTQVLIGYCGMMNQLPVIGWPMAALQVAA